jgi:deazaflavin-dependent oxidoreductase (nitroreductase family)
MGQHSYTGSHRETAGPAQRDNMGSMAKTYRLGPARRAVNTLMSAMLKIGAGGRSYYLLTTTGRASGQKRTTPVILVRSGHERWLVSPYGQVGWVHNVRAHPVVSLRRGRKTEVLRAVEVRSQAAGPVLQRYVRNVRVTAPFFDAKGNDPVERFVEEASRHPVFKLVEDTAA